MNESNRYIRCEMMREKPSRYLSAKNPSGKSYQKCGRKAMIWTVYGTPICNKCYKKLELMELQIRSTKE
jgi:hypothetical protein